MGVIATGVFKKVSIKKQTAKGTKAPAGAAGSAQYQRRTQSTVGLSKSNFQSKEINASQQVKDFRHGSKQVDGSLAQELSVGGHQTQMESVLRAAAAVGGTKTAATIAATAGAAGSAQCTLADSANGFITAGLKIYDVVDISGFTTTGVANNKRAVILTLVAGSMLVQFLNRADGATKVAGDNVTIAAVGKKISIPTTGHNRDYHTINHWHADIAQSEEFIDCVFTAMNVNVPPNDMATVEFPVMGLDMNTNTVEYFTTPASEPSGSAMSGPNGIFLIDGAEVGNLTSFQSSTNGNHSTPDGVVGKNVKPDVMPGVITDTGSLSVLFQDGTIRDKFIGEVIGSMCLVLIADNTANPDFVSFVRPKCKFNSATKDDQQTQLTQSVSFQALQSTAGGAAVSTTNTTLTIQDSQLA
jgi:hypothetical protein